MNELQQKTLEAYQSLQYNGTKSHEYKTLEAYAHDYRYMAMNENDLMDMLSGFAEALNCKHDCSSNCRRNGCNCACGEFHF